LVNPRSRSPLAKIPAYKESWASVEPAKATGALDSGAVASGFGRGEV
jgi:hypothetical protein